MNFIDACRELLAIDSSRSRGTYEAAVYISKVAKHLGFQPILTEEKGEGISQASVQIHPGDEKGGEVLLLSHLDTRDPGSYHEWTTTRENPFESTIDSTKIYGLGASSGKLDILCKLWAAKEFSKVKFKHPFSIVATYGRHHAMEGVSRLVRKGGLKSKQALIGEPTSLNLAISGRGRAVVEIFVPFAQAERELRIRHDFEESSSSRTRMFSGVAESTDLVDNPIVKMLDFMDNLPGGILILEAEGGRSPFVAPETTALEFDICGSMSETMVSKLKQIKLLILALEKKIRSHSSSGEVPSLQIGSIRTTEDGIILSGCCDLTSNLTEEVYTEWLGFIREGTRSAGAIFQLVDYKHPFHVGLNEPLFLSAHQVAKKTGLSTEPIALSSCSEASVLARRDIKCLVFGPGQGVGNSHSPNEHINIDHLHRAIAFYRDFIELVCV